MKEGALTAAEADILLGRLYDENVVLAPAEADMLLRRLLDENANSWTPADVAVLDAGILKLREIAGRQ